MKDGHVNPRRGGNFGGPLRRERGCSCHARANKVHERGRNLRPGGKGSPNGRCCFSGGGNNICLGNSNWESGTIVVHSAAAALALMEAAHAQLLAVTAQIERSFSDNGRQPTAEELAIAESIRAAVRSSAAYLATTEPVQAQIAVAHAQLVAAFSREMADADGEMLAEYGAMDAMDPLPQENVGRELDMEAVTEIDEH